MGDSHQAENPGAFWMIKCAGRGAGDCGPLPPLKAIGLVLLDESAAGCRFIAPSVWHLRNMGKPFEE